jgi:hypothetical protein
MHRREETVGPPKQARQDYTVELAGGFLGLMMIFPSLLSLDFHHSLLA